MRVLVFSDVHANVEALRAIIKEADHFDAAWCLGDLVGYGPDPNQCIEIVRELPDLLCLIGNHDQAAIGAIPLSRFNRDASSVISWTRQQLSQDNFDFLRNLASRITVEQFTLTHGSPNQPIWEYILDLHTAERNFDAFETAYCLVGHSHLPLMFHLNKQSAMVSQSTFEWRKATQLEPRMILNPGSTGQPRDGDPRASFAILDTVKHTWEMRRAEYDVAKVQARILENGLPERQALRLLAGW